MSRSIRILIVEDEFLIALDAKGILTEAGYEVVGIAASAAEAVAKMVQFAPDLVLMDIRLKGGDDGIHAAREIASRSAIPVIFVSANVDPETYARVSMAVRPLAIVSKPFIPLSLLTAVAQYKRH
jgi:CheY-like chemotaxis protein